MKKTILATSALVAVSFAPAAFAAEWETSVGGFMHVGMSYADNDSAGDGVGVLRDGEIHFSARLVADNGITFAGHVELEAYTDGDDQIDENWVSVNGSFGTIYFGGLDDVGLVVGEETGAFSSPGGIFGYVDQTGITNAASSNVWTTGIGSGVGIHYYTPSFYGFQLGATYMPSLSADELGDSNNFVYDGGDEGWSVGATYNGDFGDFHFGLAGWYADVEGVSSEQLGVSGNIGFQGFSVAGIYQDNFGDDDYALGAQYATGPWTFAGGYSDSNSVNADVVTGWITYALAPGVTLAGALEYAEAGADKDFGGGATLSLEF